MTQPEPSFSCRHLSLSNAIGEGQDDLPALLRKVATEIERQRIQPMDVLDVTIQEEVTEDGPWWSATVYWSPDEPKRDG